MAEGWNVVAQRESTEIGPDNRFAAAHVVMFKTTRGLTGTVTIPEAQFTPENVKAAIDEKVAAMHDVHDL